MKKNNKNSTKNFLLEIGTEELPSGYIEPALSQLRLSFELFLKANALSFGKIEVYGTPNRLVLYVAGLSIKQEPQREKITGPSKEIAFDKEGCPTQACLGFLKSKRAELKDLCAESTARGEYIFIERVKEASSTQKILTNGLSGLIASLKFPKVMRWNSESVHFARPVRWLLALYGTEIIGVKFGTLTASNSTSLPRYLSPVMRPVKIKSVEEYFRILKKANVMLDQEERRRKVASTLESLSVGLKASGNFNEDLIRTVIYLVECPYGFVGKFKKEYLRLPVEVLESSMAKNQKIFLVKDKKGKALPYFIAVINGKRGNVELIRNTFEAILNAKLKDSMFFLNEDLKTKLENRLDALKGVVFQAKLGSMYDRIKRVQGLSLYILDILSSFNIAISNDLDAAKRKLEKASLLSKADLATQMVREFPDLQGIIGREYAKSEGEDKDVYNAIYDHYLPKGPADSLPSGHISSILAIADKVDAIAGFYAIGLIPTGSEDPYGIRRASLGLLKILFEKKYPILLDDLITKAFEFYAGSVFFDKDAVRSQIIVFQKDRLKNILLDKNFKDDIIEAVLGPGFDRFDRLDKKLNDLSSITQAKYFIEAAKITERIFNILKAEKGLKPAETRVKPEYFVEPLEKELWDIYEKSRAKIKEKIEALDYIGATKMYAEAFYNPIHLFFEKVVVNAQDQTLRANRFALLRAIYAIYAEKVADLSKIKLS
ncbi:MAG: glycine--tRNA ligase subunit beta [Candidatus Omnitrophota bacterium]